MNCLLLVLVLSCFQNGRGREDCSCIIPRMTRECDGDNDRGREHDRSWDRISDRESSCEKNCDRGYRECDRNSDESRECDCVRREQCIEPRLEPRTFMSYSSARNMDKDSNGCDCDCR